MKTDTESPDLSLSNEYERLLNDSDSIGSIVSIHRQEKSMTVIGQHPNTNNKISISLSQEQIIKRCGTSIKRSQSINIENTVQLPAYPLHRNQSIDLSHSDFLRRPSLIPIKIPDHFKTVSSLKTKAISSEKPQRKALAISNCKIPKYEKTQLLRKWSVPNVGQENSSRPLLLESSLRNIHTEPMISEPYSLPDRLREHFSRDVRNSLPNSYKCGICLNVLSDPRVLNCLHTFCLECLFDLEEHAKNGKNSVAFSASSRETSETDFNEKSELSLQTSHSTTSFADNGENSKDSKSEKLSIKNISGNQIKKIFSSALKKRPVERKVSLKPAPKKQLSLVTEKNKTVIKCPTCSFITEISIGGINRIPKNLLLERQVQNEFNKLEMMNFTSNYCGLCSDENMAIGYCVDCNISLCDICRAAHVRQKSTSVHNVQNLCDVQRELAEPKIEQKSLPQKNVIKCFIHPTQEIKLYCINCDQVVCHNCTILLHKSHKFEPIYRAAKHSLKTIRESLERNKQFCDFVNDSISKLSGSVKKVNQRADNIQKEVEQFLQDYFEALDVHKKTLLTQISKAKETKALTILEQQGILEKRLVEAKNASAFADNLLLNGTDVEILAFVGILKQRFTYCQKSKVPLDPKIQDSLRFLPELRAPATQAQHDIPLYGIITTQTAIPKFCTLENDGPIVLRIHKKAELRMISRDADERPLCHGGLVLNVEVKYKDAPAKFLNVQINDKRDGSYLISFTPEVPGLMTLSIKIQDKDIKGSPFGLCARTLRPHSGLFHCCTFCSSNGSKTAICACESKMPGGYKGCGHGHEGHPGRRHWSCCANIIESSECSATNSFR